MFRHMRFGSGSARIRIKKCLLDPDPYEQMRIRIQELKKPRKCTGSLGEHRTGRIKVRMLDPDPHYNLCGSETLGTC